MTTSSTQLFGNLTVNPSADISHFGTGKLTTFDDISLNTATSATTRTIATVGSNGLPATGGILLLNGNAAVNLDTTGSIDLGGPMVTVEGNFNSRGNITTNAYNIVHNANQTTANTVNHDQGVIMMRTGPTVATDVFVAGNPVSYAFTITAGNASGSYLITGTCTATQAQLFNTVLVYSGSNYLITYVTASSPFQIGLSSPLVAVLPTTVNLYTQTSACLMYTDNSVYEGFYLGYYNYNGNTPIVASTASVPVNTANLHVNNLWVDGTLHAGAGLGTGTSTYTCVLSNANTTTSQVIGTWTALIGSFLVRVTGGASNASAVFMITKSVSTYASGSTLRCVSAAAASNEEIEIQWAAGAAPALIHSTASTGTAQSISYTVLVS